MAIIKGRTVSYRYANEDFETYHDLEIYPIPPSPGGPRDAYRVAIWKNGEKVFEQTYSVRTFTGGHYGLWKVANSLQHAPALVDMKSTFPHIPLPPEATFDSPDATLCSCPGVDWIQVILSGSRRAGSRNERRSRLQVFVEVEPSEAYLLANLTESRFISVSVSCTPDDVVRFGYDLEQEMIRARHLRDELGLPGPWEEPDEDEDAEGEEADDES